MPKLSLQGLSEVAGLCFLFSSSFSFFILSFISQSFFVFHWPNLSSKSILFLALTSSCFFFKDIYLLNSDFSHFFYDFSSLILFLSHLVKACSPSRCFIVFYCFSLDCFQVRLTHSIFNTSSFFYSHFFICTNRECFFSSSSSFCFKKLVRMSSFTLEMSFSLSLCSVSFLSFQSS